jgi:copper chaperone CopZ
MTSLTQDTEEVTVMAKVILDVPDISCEHCQRAIEGALRKEAGVVAVRVDVPTKNVFLDYDPSAISLDQVAAILDDEGYVIAGHTPQL